MLKRILLATSVLCLTSCAYALDGQIQDITIVTPGAEDTVCYAYVDGLRYKVHPPETVNVSRSAQNMVVDCMAPGNRRRKVVIEPSLQKHEKWNVANAGVGAVWDVASNAAFTFPDVVEVDFTSAQASPEAMPAQNNPDIPPPETHLLEEFRPGLPMMNSDRNAVPNQIQRRVPLNAPEKPEYTTGGITPHEGPGKPADKGDLQGVTDGLTTSTKSSAAPEVSKPTSAIVATPAPTTPPPAAPATGAPMVTAPQPAPATTAPATTTPAPAPQGVTINPQPLAPTQPPAKTSTTNPPGANTGAPAGTAASSGNAPIQLTK